MDYIISLIYKSVGGPVRVGFVKEVQFSEGVPMYTFTPYIEEAWKFGSKYNAELNIEILRYYGFVFDYVVCPLREVGKDERTV